MGPSRFRITGPLVPYVEGFWSALLGQGYTPLPSANLIRLMAHLSRWLVAKRLAVEELCQAHIEEFLQFRKQAGYTAFLSKRGLQPLLRYLERAGALSLRQEEEGAQTPLGRLLESYKNYLLRERALTFPTVRFYLRIARQFLSEHDGSCRFTASDVVGFILQETRKSSVGFAKYKVTALRSFLRYLYVLGQLTVDLTTAVPSVAGWRLAFLPRALAPEDVQRLLRSCDRRRDFAILLLLSRLGLRRGEVASLVLDDIHWTQAEVVVQSKGHQGDRLPLPHDVGKALVSYVCRSRPRVDSRSLFLRMRAPYHGLDPSAVTAIVHRACQRAGLATVGAHRLRHTAATEMLRHGASLSEIAHVLRHRDLNTTAIYAKVDRTTLRTLAQPWPGGAA
ncbi:MAG: tyrosine-type recombinase/integrase [Acidobacteriota bacterium]